MSIKRWLWQRWKFAQGLQFYAAYAPLGMMYSWKRDRIDAMFPGPPPGQPTPPGKLNQAEPMTNGAKFYFEEAELEVCFLTADLVRVTWKPGLLPIPYGIARSEWPDVSVDLQENAGGWAIAPTHSGAVSKVQVNQDGSLQFYDGNGQIFRHALPPIKAGAALTDEAHLRPEEAVYGLGERAFSLNLRTAREKIAKGSHKGEHTDQPKVFRMWNYDAAGRYMPEQDPMYLCIPVYMGLNDLGSYLVFYENSFEGSMTFSDTAKAEFTGGSLRYYVSSGTPAELIERYTDLTGRSPLPPLWSLGYHQSRWGYRNEEAIRETYRNFEKYDLPLSAIHLDIEVQTGFRAFTIDPDRFPKLGQFVQELQAHGIKFITILNPGIKYEKHGTAFLQGRILEAFCTTPDGEMIIAPVWPGWTVFPDYTHPRVRRWWTRQYAYLLEVGVAGFWHDMNEPAVFSSGGDPSLPKATRHYMEGRGGDHREAHNLYGMMQTQAAYASLRDYRPKHRPFLVTRAGWAGVQRYAWTWTGDVYACWPNLKLTMSIVMGLGLSGIPYSGSDIGGFQGNPSPELYLRWFQMACFFTFCRTHSSNNAEHRTPWMYGEPTVSLIREALRLRYRMLPYFYTLAWETAQTGVAPVRPTFWNDSSNSKLWSVDDQFLLGDALLVCPATEDGQRSRPVILPNGHWYDFWSDRLLEGNTTVELEAPIEHIPLLVEAGRILPMSENGELTLHLYPPQHENYTTKLYSDAGDGYDESRVDYFHIIRKEQGVELIWEQTGNYMFPYKSVTVHIHGNTANQIWVDNMEMPCEANQIRCDHTFHRMYIALKEG